MHNDLEVSSKSIFLPWIWVPHGYVVHLVLCSDLWDIIGFLIREPLLLLHTSVSHRFVSDLLAWGALLLLNTEQIFQNLSRQTCAYLRFVTWPWSSSEQNVSLMPLVYNNNNNNNNNNKINILMIKPMFQNFTDICYTESAFLEYIEHHILT